MTVSIISRAKQLGYRAELLTPISPPLSGEPDDTWVNEERLAKIDLLFDHYGRPKTDKDFIRIIESLAIDWVPGFTVKEQGKRGRPKKSQEDHRRLISLIDAERRAHPNAHLSDLCRFVLKKHPDDRRWAGKSDRTLANEYTKGRKAGITKVLDGAIRYVPVATRARRTGIEIRRRGKQFVLTPARTKSPTR